MLHLIDQRIGTRLASIIRPPTPLSHLRRVARMSRKLFRFLLSLTLCTGVSTGAISFASANPLEASEMESLSIDSIKNPESVCYGPDGLLYISEIGEAGKEGDGRILVIKNGKATPFATGLDDPKGIALFKNELYVTDVNKIIRIDSKGNTSVYVSADKFPDTPHFLNDLTVMERDGVFLVSDSGKSDRTGGAVYLINDKTKEVKLVASEKNVPSLKRPNGVTFDGESFIIVGDFDTGELHRVSLVDGKSEKIAEGLEGADGLFWDYYGRLFITSWTQGKVFGIPQPGQKPILMSDAYQAAADACLSQDGKYLIVPDMKAGTVTTLSSAIPGWEVDETPLPLEFAETFSNLVWEGWNSDPDKGAVTPLRPIVLTHANDGSGKTYIATQHGVIYSLDKSNEATKAEVFLDISDRVRYSDRQNEEGFLGLAFHPEFDKTGELFVFYTDVNAKMANVVSRFTVKKDNPKVGDPASEEELVRFEKPFWNHDGGCLVFGPDNYLYITHGDGGAGGDPHQNGQKLSTLLGKVLRIDVNRKENGKNYAIPADNPFVGKSGALPEIYAYGLRNVWRMAFDKETGKLWGGEVGQNLYEEIVFIEKGGNYGWSQREGFHPFGAKGVDVNESMIEPIWEYNHDIGKSLTGGFVYRGSKFPELQGAYIYADYVTNRVWALRYDEKAGRVISNQPIANPVLSILSFGEDEDGEIYALIVSNRGRGIYGLRSTKN